MNFKLTSESGAKLAMWISVVVMAIALLFMFVVPKPTTKGLQSKQMRDESEILKDISAAKKSLADSQAKVVSRTWSGGAQEVGPGVLQEINALAAKHKVKLSGFRPERIAQAPGVDLLPFSVTAEGSFMDVVGYVKAIEDPANKIAVDQIRIASTDANGDQVTATIGITTYHVAEAAKHV